MHIFQKILYLFKRQIPDDQTPPFSCRFHFPSIHLSTADYIFALVISYNITSGFTILKGLVIPTIDKSLLSHEQ